MAKKDWFGFNVDDINDNIGVYWEDVDYTAKKINDVITDSPVIPVIGNNVDGDIDIIGFTF